MRRVKTPVLILTGSRDQQAVPEQVALQEAAFKEGGNKDVMRACCLTSTIYLCRTRIGFRQKHAKHPAADMMRADVLTMSRLLAQRCGDEPGSRLRSRLAFPRNHQPLC